VVTVTEQSRDTYEAKHRRDLDAEHEQKVQRAVALLRDAVNRTPGQICGDDADDIRLLLGEYDRYVELRETHEQLAADERRQYDELIKAEERWRTVSNAYNVLGDAPAFDGAARNAVYPESQRLQLAIAALDSYGAVIESIEQAEQIG
jgi:hypothetical protein